MSIVYDVKLVLLILKETVWPTFTEMFVAKPWMPGSPASPLGVSQTDWGVPGSWFSQGMGLAVQSTAWTGTARNAIPGSRIVSRARRPRRPRRRPPRGGLNARGLIGSALPLRSPKRSRSTSTIGIVRPGSGVLNGPVWCAIPPCTAAPGSLVLIRLSRSQVPARQRLHPPRCGGGGGGSPSALRQRWPPAPAAAETLHPAGGPAVGLPAHGGHQQQAGHEAPQLVGGDEGRPSAQGVEEPPPGADPAAVVEVEPGRLQKRVGMNGRAGRQQVRRGVGREIGEGPLHGRDHLVCLAPGRQAPVEHVGAVD